MATRYWTRDDGATPRVVIRRVDEQTPEYFNGRGDWQADHTLVRDLSLNAPDFRTMHEDEALSTVQRLRSEKLTTV